MRYGSVTDSPKLKPSGQAVLPLAGTAYVAGCELGLEQHPAQLDELADVQHAVCHLHGEQLAGGNRSPRHLAGCLPVGRDKPSRHDRKPPADSARSRSL